MHTGPVPQRLGSSLVCSPNRTLTLVAVVALTVACAADPATSSSSSPSSSSDADAGAASDAQSAPAELDHYKPCPAAQRLGGFKVVLAEKFTAVEGQVFDAVDPQTVSEVLQEAGDCKLLRSPALFCSPPCGLDQKCAPGGKCVPAPASKPVGAVTVSGLKVAVAMSPKWGNTYLHSGDMPHPGFDVGARIGLRAAGGDIGAFNLLGTGVAALVVATANTKPNVQAGKDLKLAWTPPSASSAARVHVALNINEHGSTSARILCDAPDTGTFAVPAALLDALRALGTSGFPSLSLSRRTVDSASLALGCVELIVRSDVELTPSVDGVVSCTADKQCPGGQICSKELACTDKK